MARNSRFFELLADATARAQNGDAHVTPTHLTVGGAGKLRGREATSIIFDDAQSLFKTYSALSPSPSLSPPPEPEKPEDWGTW